MQTYYVTLDLTSVNDPPKRQRKQNGGRAVKPRWVNPDLKFQRERDRRIVPTFKNGVSDPDASDNEGGEGGEDDEDREEEGEEEEEDEPEDAGEVRAPEPHGPKTLQILDLHSKNPIISYNGNTFSCEWASNIGTELLFTYRDPIDPLPSLRTMPGDVDLLAASSARIISTTIQISPKGGLRQASKAPAKRRSQAGKDPDLAIPVGIRASDERKDQARFLEELIDLKESRGEYDPVTILVNARRGLWKWKTYMEGKRKTEMKSLQKKVQKGGRNASAARERIKEIEEEERWRKEYEEQNIGRSDGRRIRGKGKFVSGRKQSVMPGFENRPDAP